LSEFVSFNPTMVRLLHAWTQEFITPEK